jgi:ribosomal protein L37AE/L43A
MNRDISPVRPVLHDNLYFTTEKQVQSKITSGVVYHYEKMVVNTAYLTAYAKDSQFEYITLYLNARRIDWEEDEKTGKIIRGDKTTRWDMRYTMKFMRSLGVVTKEASGKLMGHNCPNCAATLDISSSGQCSYCGSTVTTGQYSWVLSDYGTIRNDTVDEGVHG